MSPHTPHTWKVIPLSPFAHVAMVQLLTGAILFSHMDPKSLSRGAVTLGATIGVVTLPLAPFTAYLLRVNPLIHHLTGRAWAAFVPLFFAMTISDAYDGTGPAFAENIMTPFMLSVVVGLSFAIGAQGALLAVPSDLLWHVALTMIAMAVMKLHAAYTHAYLVLHVAFLSGILLGYMCVLKYADLREAERDAAELIVNTAVLTKQPYVVIDSQLTILAINNRFTDVLGYEIDDVYGKHVSCMLETYSLPMDSNWTQIVIENKQREHVWSVVTKQGPLLPVRITFGETHCPRNGTKFYYAKFSSMALEHRNAQLKAEKERLQWDLANSQCYECAESTPRQILSVRVQEGTHHTLGAMKDPLVVARAISNAHSYDHVDSRDPSPVINPTSSPPSTTSIVSRQSSVMDTVSVAAAKDVTRAPAPIKDKRLQRPKRVCSEPSSTPKTGCNNKQCMPPERTLPTVERVVPVPSEDC